MSFALSSSDCYYPASNSKDSSGLTRSSQNWQTFVDVIEPDILQSGDTGNAVKILQLALRAIAIYDGPIDGDFGPKTTDAIQTLQTILDVEINGIFDIATWYAFSFWAPESVM